MLRITPTRSLEFRSKKSRLTPELWKGLTIAFVFHFLFLSGLRIVKNHHAQEIPPLSPVAVEVDLGLPEPYTDAEPQLTLSPLHEELPTFPRLPQEPVFSYEREIAATDPDFTIIEAIPYKLHEDEEL